MVVFLLNSVIFVSLLLCLCIIIVRLYIFIAMYVLYSVSLCFVYCLCVNVYFQLPPGLNPIAVNKIYQYMSICRQKQTTHSHRGGHTFFDHLAARKKYFIFILSPCIFICLSNFYQLMHFYCD